MGLILILFPIENSERNEVEGGEIDEEVNLVVLQEGHFKK
jgi:hypothetical protein